MTYELAIIKNETEDHHLEWVAACESSKEDINFDIIDITRNDWLDLIMKKDYQIFLTRPPDKITFFKQLYDERIYIINKILNKPIYPTYEEILVYENKKFLSYWLKANQVPHPETNVFYNKDEALEFIQQCPLPQVGKTSIGAAGSGVKILKTRSELQTYINQAFSEQGIPRRWGPNLRKGNLTKRLLNRLKNIPELFRYLKKKKQSVDVDPHRWFAILQKYIPVDFEWRAVRIDDSFFAHKKLGEQGGLISGTSKVSWDGPDYKLLDFVKMVTDKRGFISQAVDIFTDKEGNFL
ncbi:MAG: hypothetical protein GY757_19410, partial [bacterium]|nr:hypothetical protein [bacterium]